MLEPIGAAFRGFAPALLVDLQDRRVHDAVGERLPGQRVEAAGPRRDELAAAGEHVEIFEDDAAVVEGCAVLEHQRRDLAERILPRSVVVGIGGVGGDDLDAVRKPEDRRRDA